VHRVMDMRRRGGVRVGGRLDGAPHGANDVRKAEHVRQGRRKARTSLPCAAVIIH